MGIRTNLQFNDYTAAQVIIWFLHFSYSMFLNNLYSLEGLISSHSSQSHKVNPPESVIDKLCGSFPFIRTCGETQQIGWVPEVCFRNLGCGKNLPREEAALQSVTCRDMPWATSSSASRLMSVNTMIIFTISDDYQRVPRMFVHESVLQVLHRIGAYSGLNLDMPSTFSQ